ncbi:unnamed protein product [Brassica oleracea var. botrytis]|uniref:Uncharacterized protein n=1 Tax=Brassica oleracea TaxID=3712 RepID=A0A3P6FSH5_BRAOL|nr:unnamed protein product [Brassica oleracea]
MDMTIYQSLVAKWKTLPTEMKNYKLDRKCAAISLQVYTVGHLVGLIFESPSVFSNSITDVGFPIVPVSVIVFHDKMDVMKIFSEDSDPSF